MSKIRSNSYLRKQMEIAEHKKEREEKRKLKEAQRENQTNFLNILDDCAVEFHRSRMNAKIS